MLVDRLMTLRSFFLVLHLVALLMSRVVFSPALIFALALSPLHPLARTAGLCPPIRSDAHCLLARLLCSIQCRVLATVFASGGNAFASRFLRATRILPNNNALRACRASRAGIRSIGRVLRLRCRRVSEAARSPLEDDPTARPRSILPARVAFPCVVVARRYERQRKTPDNEDRPSHFASNLRIGPAVTITATLPGSTELAPPYQATLPLRETPRGPRKYQSTCT